MPKIYLCFVWHMHQPFYKDLVTGEYRLPWTRLHALKDYYGMVKILEQFPEVRQTFNLVPSLLVQLEDYASGRAVEPFWRLALKPAGELTPEEAEFLVKHSFQANEERQIKRYPRYSELFELARRHQDRPDLATAEFDAQMLRDLQVLSQLVWFDEKAVQGDWELVRLARKARDFSAEDQATLGRKQTEALANVLPVYREFASTGQIELSATPFYHPILPLLCDSDIAGVSHPYGALPSRFSYPDDAREQLARARDHFAATFGTMPDGLWPSEGSVSDQTLEIASGLGFRWIAADDEVLLKTLGGDASADAMCQPYLWKQGGKQIHVVFRNHRLSDLIGFVYPKMDPGEAAHHLLGEIHATCKTRWEKGQDALVAIMLDGENPWENYAENGRPFLRKLYAGITADPRISAVTVSEGIAAVAAGDLERIHPGSWIDANFDIWIGSEENNRYWELLLQTRLDYDRLANPGQGAPISQERKRKAWEELMIAEGSDWSWWYTSEHASVNKQDFDKLYRNHLANVYRFLDAPPPAVLFEPIVSRAARSLHEEPTGLIQPEIDGEVSSRQEWAGAGRYQMDKRSSGAMHSQRSPIQELLYGSDGQSLFLRVDIAEVLPPVVPLAFRLRLRNQGEESFEIAYEWRDGRIMISAPELPENAVSAALGTTFETRISMTALHVRRGEPVFLRLSLFRNGLRVAELPESGELGVLGSMAAYSM